MHAVTNCRAAARLPCGGASAVHVQLPKPPLPPLQSTHHIQHIRVWTGKLRVHGIGATPRLRQWLASHALNRACIHHAIVRR